MLRFDIIQGTDEWKQLRAGLITASPVQDILAEQAGRKNYIARLVAERLSGEPCGSDYISKEMQWGIDHEPEARALYELTTGRTVTTVGFAVHPEYEWSGASPDGLVGDDGMVEIKCPNTATHIETIRTSKIPMKYFAQMQWEMECAEREWCDFVSYDPRIKHEKLMLYIYRVQRDEAFLTKARAKLRVANIEVDKIVAELLEKAS